MLIDLSKQLLSKWLYKRPFHWVPVAGAFKLLEDNECEVYDDDNDDDSDDDDDGEMMVTMIVRITMTITITMMAMMIIISIVIFYSHIMRDGRKKLYCSKTFRFPSHTLISMKTNKHLKTCESLSIIDVG